ncbi:hypothetical protein C0J52_07389, partial [Blattella germanica]
TLANFLISPRVCLTALRRRLNFFFFACRNVCNIFSFLGVISLRHKLNSCNRLLRFIPFSAPKGKKLMAVEDWPEMEGCDRGEIHKGSTPRGPENTLEILFTASEDAIPESEGIEISETE